MQFEVKTVSALESYNLQIESWQVDKKVKGSILDNSLAGCPHRAVIDDFHHCAFPRSSLSTIDINVSCGFY